MSLLTRALRGVREHLRTQLVSVATVALALFCLGGAVLATENVGALSARWGAPVRMTVYLADGASSQQVDALRGALAELPEVAEARYVSPADARARLLQGEGDGALAGAPVELFPAAIELRLAPRATDAERIASLAARVRRLPAVTDVETYRGLTEQLRGLLATGRAAALVIALVVALCATAVVSNTVRLSLHARMREVEVLRLVGASPRYVRAPFLVEGALLGGGGALLALLALGGLFVWLRARFDGSIGALLGVHPAFLSLTMVAAFLLGGSALGAAGSALALRRWLRV
jgi:cell division transport system permease protein